MTVNLFVSEHTVKAHKKHGTKPVILVFAQPACFDNRKHVVKCAKE